MDKPKMPEPSMVLGCEYYPYKSVAAHHAEWEAYVAQLRDMVLAAVPGEMARSERDSDVDWGYYLGYNGCRYDTIAAIYRLFEQEPGNG